MSKRFGRNQRRRAREELADANRQLDVMAACYANERSRADNLERRRENAQQRYLAEQAMRDALQVSIYHDKHSNTFKVDNERLRIAIQLGVSL